MDRIEAIMKLKDMKEEAAARNIVVSALKDKNWLIRHTALSVIDNLTDDELKAVHETLKELALHDKVSKVRAAAVEKLAKHYRMSDNRDVFVQTAKDKSPLVIKATGASKE